MADLTLEELCRKQDNSYTELAKACWPRPIVGLGIKQGGWYDVGSPQIGVGLVRNCQFVGHSYIHSEGDWVFAGQGFQEDRVRGGYEDYRKHHLSQLAGLTTHQVVEEECIFLGGTWLDFNEPDRAPNFGHFVFEFVSRLAVFHQAGLLFREVPVVVYDHLPLEWYNFLKLAGVRTLKLIKIKDLVTFKQAWTGSCPYSRTELNAFRGWPVAAPWLTAQVLANLTWFGKPADTRHQANVFLVRQGAAKARRLVNQDQAVELATRYGFKPIDPINLTAVEQVKLVRDASVIITVQGAGTSLLQFCPSHCKTIVMASPDSWGYWGGHIQSFYQRQAWERLNCKVVPIEGLERLNAFGKNELVDLEVDLNELEKLILHALVGPALQPKQRQNPLSPTVPGIMAQFTSVNIGATVNFGKVEGEP